MKSVKNLNQFFWVIEYWCKAKNYQTFVKEYKAIFIWKQRKPWSFPKYSFHTGVNKKLALTSAEYLNWIFWVTEYCYKAQKYQIWSPNRKPGFFWKLTQALKLFKNFFPILELPLWTCFEVRKRPKSNLPSDLILVKDSICKFVFLFNKCKTIFLAKISKDGNFQKTFFQYFRYLKTCFEVRQKYSDWLNISQKYQFFDWYKTLFLGKWDKPRNFPKDLCRYWSYL